MNKLKPGELVGVDADGFTVGFGGSSSSPHGTSIGTGTGTWSLPEITPPELIMSGNCVYLKVNGNYYDENGHSVLTNDVLAGRECVVDLGDIIRKLNAEMLKTS
jgi:hypothetical protein